MIITGQMYKKKKKMSQSAIIRVAIARSVITIAPIITPTTIPPPPPAATGIIYAKIQEMDINHTPPV